MHVSLLLCWLAIEAAPNGDDPEPTTIPAPFQIAVPEAVLSDLRGRLNLTRWPDELDLSNESAWGMGLPVAYARELVAYWCAAGVPWR
jgi:hypothetical protein